MHFPCAFICSEPTSSSRSLTCFFTTKTPPSKASSLAGRSYQGKNVSAASPPQPFLQEPLSLPYCCCCCCHRRCSLTSGLQELSKEALGSPCALNLLSPNRHLDEGGKASVEWAGSGLSAQVLATGLSCTQGLLSSFDILKDPGRECLRKKTVTDKSLSIPALVLSRKQSHR